MPSQVPAAHPLRPVIITTAIPPTQDLEAITIITVTTHTTMAAPAGIAAHRPVQSPTATLVATIPTSHTRTTTTETAAATRTTHPRTIALTITLTTIPTTIIEQLTKLIVFICNFTPNSRTHGPPRAPS